MSGANGWNLAKYVVMTFCIVVMSVSAWITMWIGPIPYTMQNFGATIIALLLAPKDAFITVALYLLLIATGAPVAANFRGGIYVLYGYTAGYLWGFLISVPLASRIVRVYLGRRGVSLDRISRRDFAMILFLVSVSMIPVYILGFTVFLYYATLSQNLYRWAESVVEIFGFGSSSRVFTIFTASVLAFIPQDVLMDHVLGVAVAVEVYRFLKKLGMRIG